MKVSKNLIYLIVIVLIISMAFMGISCKEETTPIEEAIEEESITEDEEDEEKILEPEETVDLDFTPKHIMIEEKYDSIAPSSEFKFGWTAVWDFSLQFPADELGWFDDVNLNMIEVKDFASALPKLEALNAGSVDISGHVPIGTISLAKTLDNIMWGFPMNNWWGNAVLVRPGEMKTWTEILEENGDGDGEAAAREAALQLKGKTINMEVSTTFEPFITAVLEFAGLTKNDVEFNDLPCTESATAFLRGEGDAFYCNLPSRYRVAEEGALDLIDGKYLGKKAWIFTGYLFNEEWLAENEDTAMRFMGVIFRVADVLEGQDQNTALEIMRTHVNDGSGSSFTMEQAHYVNDVINPWFTVEEAKDVFFNPENEFFWNDRLQWLIDLNIEKGVLEEGDVTIESHSVGLEMFEKYWNYKVQAEADMTIAADAYNAGKAENPAEVKSLIEQAKWNWDIRNYIDAAKLASNAKTAATGI